MDLSFQKIYYPIVSQLAFVLLAMRDEKRLEKRYVEGFKIRGAFETERAGLQTN